MSYFLKFTFAVWFTMGFLAPLIFSLSSLVQMIVFIALIVSIFLIFKMQTPKTYAKNLAESNRLWSKPWWQSALLGVAIWAPAFTIGDFVESMTEESRFTPGSDVLSGLILGSLFGLFMSWRARHYSLTAQSD
ncbi:MAG: hypothetical protein AAGH90_07155 [Pseudomonadota bacterium]